MSSEKSDKCKIELLYQKRPQKGNKHSFRSKTNSLASYRKDALHEYGKLRVNGTVPNHIVQVNYLVEMPKKEIQALWTKHSRRLRRAGIVARAAVEVTRDKWKQRPVNRVHYHFVAKDDRSPDEMQELFEAVCRSEMDQSAFNVHIFPFKEELGGWQGYMEYFLKIWDDDNILLAKRGLRKYYTINEKQWWTYPDGTPRTIVSIKKEMQQYKIAKKHLKQSERFFEIIKHPPVETEKPTDCAKLIATLEKETDETLYDWFAILLGKPTVFGTKPPKWLLDYIHKTPKKRFDLFNTLYIVISDTDIPIIRLAFEIYFGCKLE